MIDREPITEVGLDALRQRLAASKRAADASAIDRQLDGDDLEDRVAAGMVKGFALIVEDDKLVKKFGRRLYEELVAHSTDGATRWFGQRLLATVILSMVVYGLVWLGRNGK